MENSLEKELQPPVFEIQLNKNPQSSKYIINGAVLTYKELIRQYMISAKIDEANAEKHINIIFDQEKKKVVAEKDEATKNFELTILEATDNPISYVGSNKGMSIAVRNSFDTNEYRIYPYPLTLSNMYLAMYFRSNDMLNKFYHKYRCKDFYGIEKFAIEIDSITVDRHFDKYKTQFKIVPFSFNKEIPTLNYIDYEKIIEASNTEPKLFLNALNIFENPDDYCAWWGFNMANLCKGQALMVIGHGGEGKTTLSKLLSKLIVGEDNFSDSVVGITKDMVNDGFSESLIGKVFAISDDLKDDKILESSFMHKFACNKGNNQTFRIKNGSDYNGEVTFSIIVHENFHPKFNSNNPNESRRYIWVNCVPRDNTIGTDEESNKEVGYNPAAYGRSLSSIEFENTIMEEKYAIIAHCLKCAGVLDYVKECNDIHKITGFKYNKNENKQVQSRAIKENIKTDTTSSEQLEQSEFVDKWVTITGDEKDKINADDLTRALGSYFDKRYTQAMKRNIKIIIEERISKTGKIKRRDTIARLHGAKINQTIISLNEADKVPESERRIITDGKIIVQDTSADFKDKTPLEKAKVKIEYNNSDEIDPMFAEGGMFYVNP